MLVELDCPARYTYQLYTSQPAHVSPLPPGQGGQHGRLGSLPARSDFMRFALIDRISKLDPGKQIVALKSPTLSEEYLQDHFPMFPVMPGVLMLEAMYQASAWLLRVTDDFAYSMVLLKEAKNIKYSGFVKPGETLEIEATIQKREGNESWLNVEGRRAGEVVVRAKLILECGNLPDDQSGNASINHNVIRKLKDEFGILYAPPGVKEVVG